MEHLTDEQVMNFIHNKLTESQRISFEDHLYNCDPCFQRTIQVVGEMEDELPKLTVGDQWERHAYPSDPFIDAIMEKLPPQNESMKKVEKSRFQQPIFHYVVAASITLVLMGSGVFQGLSGWISTVNAAPVKQESSISKQMMNKALSWIEFLEPKQKEGKQ